MRDRVRTTTEKKFNKKNFFYCCNKSTLKLFSIKNFIFPFFLTSIKIDLSINIQSIEFENASSTEDVHAISFSISIIRGYAHQQLYFCLSLLQHYSNNKTICCCAAHSYFTTSICDTAYMYIHIKIDKYTYISATHIYILKASIACSLSSLSITIDPFI